MAKTRRIRKVTREKLIKLFEEIGYKVTRQSTDGHWMLLRLPDGTSTQYWLFSDCIEHKMDDFRGGAYFSYSDCDAIIDLEPKAHTVSLIAKGSKNSGVFVSFHNFRD